MRLRDAEGGHDGIAGELLDDPAVRGHAVRDAVEEPLDTSPHDLRVRPCDERGRVDEVDKQDRGELAFHSSSVETTGQPLGFLAEPDGGINDPAGPDPTTDVSLLPAITFP